MVHGAALVVSAIRQDLFAHFSQKKGSTLAQPPVSVGPLKICAPEQQRLGILEQMIGLNFVLQVAFQPADLLEKALVPGGRKVAMPAARERELDPVHDSQGSRVGLPAGAAPRR